MLLIPPAISAPVPPEAATLVCKADRLEVEAGEAIQLSWTASRCTEVILQPMGQRLAPQGSLTLIPSESVTYWLSASNLVGGEVRPIRITVKPKAGASPSVQPSVPSGPVPVAQVPAATDGAAWIQLEAIEDRAKAESRRESLSQKLGEAVVLQEATSPNADGRTVFRLRLGPFSDPKAAKQRLKSLTSALKGLKLKPIVTVH